MHVVVEQSNLFTWLEGWEADVRASVASESIAKRTVATRANLALHGEVDLGQVVGSQLNALELLIGRGSLVGVFGGKTFSQAASAVLAGTAAFASLGLTFGSYYNVRIVLRVGGIRRITYGY